MSEIARQAVGQRHRAGVAERANRPAVPGLQREHAMPAVEEHAEPVAVAPERGTAQLPAARRQDLTELVRLAVEPPQFPAGLGVQRRHAVVGRGDVQHAVDHQRRGLEETGRGAELLERRLPVLPLPGDAEPLDVLRADVGQRRVLRPARIAAVMRAIRRGLRTAPAAARRRANQPPRRGATGAGAS